MSCSPDLIKDLVLGEVPRAERERLEQHVRTCAECHEEFARVSAARTALMSVADEEPPRRIAFVSDKVFEPAWWQRMRSSAGRLGFASAALLAGAIVAHGYLARPVATAPAADTAAIEARIEQQVNARLEQAVTRAVSDAETRQARKAAELLTAAEKRMEFDRQADRVAVEENLKVLRSQLGQYMVASNQFGAR